MSRRAGLAPPVPSPASRERGPKRRASAFPALPRVGVGRGAQASLSREAGEGTGGRFAPAVGVSRASLQYVARPPETSNTAPVVNEHSSLASQVMIAAISSTVPKRSMGIFERI